MAVPLWPIVFALIIVLLMPLGEILLRLAGMLLALIAPLVIPALLLCLIVRALF